jgi:hypothetical protein
MRRTRLPVRLVPLARTVGPYGWAVAGLLAGVLLARSYVRRLPRPDKSEAHDVLRWEAEGGSPASAESTAS